MRVPVVMYTDEALQYFIEAGLIQDVKKARFITKSCKEYINLHFYICPNTTQIKVATMFTEGDTEVTLEEFICWFQMMPTAESKKAYLADIYRRANEC